jgi:hypothetical protein
VARALAQTGFDVTVCNGPVGRVGCALADTGACAFVEAADLVVAVDPGSAAMIRAALDARP